MKKLTLNYIIYIKFSSPFFLINNFVYNETNYDLNNISDSQSVTYKL